LYLILFNRVIKIIKVDKWIKEQGIIFLKEVGIKKEYIIFDCCCGEGNYTIPAAKISSKDGTVYAMDMNKNKLNTLKGKSNLESIKMKKHSFKDYAIVSCGTLSPELNYLKNSKFLDAKKILYTKPGRHEVPTELESQLINKLNIAKKYSENIIVVYGGKYCYINIKEPYKTIDRIIKEQGKNISRINASHCIDMLSSEKERENIANNVANGEKVWWLTPGWIIYRHLVFQDWDKAMANENFPKHTGGAILLDGIGFWEKYIEDHAEKILEFSDWMGIPIQPYKISLIRLKKLLLEKIR
jgi:hypothetical protein